MQLDTSLRSLIQRNLQALDLQRAASIGHRAAVALAVAEEGAGAQLPGFPEPAAWSPQAALILTRRAQSLSNHPGQWALPGGRVEPGESAEQAALRELAEEVGLQLDSSTVLGRLDDFVTRSGFVITPVVIWGSAAPLRPDPAEVARIDLVPFESLLAPDAVVLQSIPQSERPVLALSLSRPEGLLYAPTAAILHQFAEVGAHGRATRVAHYEQPLFAWR